MRAKYNKIDDKENNPKDARNVVHVQETEAVTKQLRT